MLPSDQRLLSLHLEFVKKAERLAQEYERSRDWDKARTVYQEILKLTPNYQSARARLEELRQREANAERVTVQIHANQGWQKTGVLVQEGKPLILRAAGSWTYQLKLRLGPDGVKIPKELRDFNLGSLVGVIDTGSQEELKPFMVGSELAMTAEQTGQLYLKMYDVDPEDNEGVLEVEIRGTFERAR